MNLTLEMNGATQERSLSERALKLEAKAGSGKAVIRFSIPILDMHCYWSPARRTPSMKLDWRIELESAGQRYLPILSFFNSRGENRGTFGVTDLIDDCKLTAQMNQEFCRYDVTVEVAVPEDRDIPFELLLDFGAGDWRDALHRCIANFGVALPEFPAAAWEPVYCTWYAVHASVTQEWAEDTAKRAAELGFKTFIIDDGWCFDDMRRVTPETIGFWYEKIGDCDISTKKFPDFDAHLARVKAMGLRYMLWVTPFLIGVKSEMFRRLGENGVLPGYLEGYQLLNIDHADGCEEMIESLTSLMRKHDLDGLKIDFLDQLYPSMQGPRGRKITEFIAALTDGIRAVKSDALIEFREGYATPSMLPYATQFRAGDVPFDFQDNFRRLAQIRLELGDGVPVHSDPAYWHPEELPENISRHMIASLAGVPMLSMDLEEMRDEAKAIVRHWLDFYQAHLELFQTGHWVVQYHQGDISYVSVSKGEESIVILSDDARLPEVARSGTIILNLTPSELQCPGMKAFDCMGYAAGNKIPLGGYAHL